MIETLSLLSRLVLVAALVTGVCSQIGAADQPRPDSEPQQQVDGLAIEVTVLMSDGSPAAGAALNVSSNMDKNVRTFVADDSGKAVLRDLVDLLRVHALSRDQRYQAVMWLPGAALRTVAADGIKIELAPATPHQFVITAEDRPVEGATVLVMGSASNFKSFGTTGTDGKSVVWCPPNIDRSAVVAWHPKLGVNGFRREEGVIEETTTQLSLLPAKPHVIRLVDSDGQPVPHISLGAHLRMEDTGWILAAHIPATQQETNAEGEVRFDWFPAEGLLWVDIELAEPGWNIDEIDRDTTADGLTTVHVRREIAVEGQVVMPNETDRAEGMLVTGRGFGPGNHGDIPFARTRKDGRFTLTVPSKHGFLLGIVDNEWACDLWSGMILGSETDEPKEIVLEAYQATPLEIHVTRGSFHEPVAGAWIEHSRRADVALPSNDGTPRTGHTGVSQWLVTDAEGIARTGTGRGKTELRLSADGWSETRSITVDSTESIRIDFHRKWLANRVVIGQPQRDGKNFVPSNDAVALAWTKDPALGITKKHHPEVTDDGQVQVTFDEEQLSLLLLDRKQHLSGFVDVGIDDSAVEIEMQPTAAYSGQLTDRNGNPLPDRTLRLITEKSFQDVVEPQQTDSEGRFSFTDVAASIPLRISISNERGQPAFTVFSGKKIFEPGEVRRNDEVEATSRDEGRVVPQVAERMIPERVASTTENATAIGLKPLVLVLGDDAERVTSVSSRLQNGAEAESIYGFLPMIVTAEQRHEQPEALTTLGWETPSANELLVLVIAADGSDVAASLRLTCDDVNSAVERGAKFLEQHRPPTRDARQLFNEALEEARSTDRTVWVICGGPRCGPCMGLARWIHQYHETLEKDLVVVKLTAFLDEGAETINEEIGGDGFGIPFHALLTPEGTVLITSEGPLGNIGKPGTVEGLRHFRAMLNAAQKRMTEDDIDRLIESLAGPN